MIKTFKMILMFIVFFSSIFVYGNNNDVIIEKYIMKAPVSIQLYYFTKKYCKQYNVPEEIAFSVAGLETGYRNPIQFQYRSNLTSSASAFGAYQILLNTAKSIYEGNKNDITRERLLNDINLNTRLGIKYLSYLYSLFNNWSVACGYYNTGYPMVNGYALMAVKYHNN